MSFEVKLNKWDKKFENDIACDLCGRKGHVVVFPICNQLELCQACLHEAICAIYGAIMQSIPKWNKPRSQENGKNL